MKTQIFSIITAFAVILTFACKKPKDGINGKDGATGAAGPMGNANVQAQNLTFTSWTHFGTAGSAGDGYQSIQSCFIITPSIVSTGAVLAYLWIGSTSTWVALPYSQPFASWTSHWTYGYSANQFTLQTQDSDFYTLDPSGTYPVVKVVCVASSKMGDPNITWSDYNDVKKKLNLPD